jgi:hypothetical protein
VLLEGWTSLHGKLFRACFVRVFPYGLAWIYLRMIECDEARECILGGQIKSPCYYPSSCLYLFTCMEVLSKAGWWENNGVCMAAMAAMAAMRGSEDGVFKSNRAVLGACAEID